ncbi:hypothetical protein MKW98_017599 [Papaver atlanticum]|uniref:DUF632 domain-containing protein n=1 Tax=Papaver atlanticum TaxID=357466 RepID=A0AAD4TEK7_9MAGN|nr:hypothetical protein MKW98_017599 [Papaver atlanticum]
MKNERELLLWSKFHSESKKLLLVVRHKDLAEIAACIKEYFEKAVVAETVYHSNSLLTNLSSSWTSKPPLEIKYLLDTCALVEQGPKSHFSTLERLLAWEKKLYQEVKLQTLEQSRQLCYADKTDQCRVISHPADRIFAQDRFLYICRLNNNIVSLKTLKPTTCWERSTVTGQGLEGVLLRRLKFWSSNRNKFFIIPWIIILEYVCIR